MRCTGPSRTGPACFEARGKSIYDTRIFNTPWKTCIGSTSVSNRKTGITGCRVRIAALKGLFHAPELLPEQVGRGGGKQPTDSKRCSRSRSSGGVVNSQPIQKGAPGAGQAGGVINSQLRSAMPPVREQVRRRGCQSSTSPSCSRISRDWRLTLGESEHFYPRRLLPELKASTYYPRRLLPELIASTFYPGRLLPEQRLGSAGSVNPRERCSRSSGQGVQGAPGAHSEKFFTHEGCSRSSG